MFRSILLTLIFLVYPYLVYRGMQQGVVWFAPTLIAGFYINDAMKTQHKQRRMMKLLIALVLLTGAVFWQALTAKLLPIFIQLTLMHFFGTTLFKGPSLIERFVRMEFADFPPEIVTYCWQLTLLWTGFFAFNALVCAGLALWGSDVWWAFYNGVMIFVLTGVLMVGEYIWRHFRFPELDIPSPKSSVRNMIVNGRAIWKEVHAS